MVVPPFSRFLCSGTVDGTPPSTKKSFQSYIHTSLPGTEVRLFLLSASPLQPSASVMQARRTQGVAPESVAQRDRMTDTVKHLKDLPIPMGKIEVTVRAGVRLWAISDAGCTPGMNFLNENHVSECRIVKKGPDLTLPPVRFVFLKERGGGNAYTIPVVSWGKMMVSITECEPMEIRVLVFRPGAFPCVALMIDPAPHAVAKQARIDAKVKQHEEEELGRLPDSVQHSVARPSDTEPVVEAPAAKRNETRASKKAAVENLRMTVPRVRSISCSHSSAVVSIGRVLGNTRRNQTATRVAIHANLSQNRMFWLEEVLIPCSAIRVDPSRTVPAFFSSATSAWHVVCLLLKDNRFNPCLEKASRKGNPRRSGPPGRLWSVFFVAPGKHCHATSFAAIMCPEQCILRDPRGNGGRQLTTTSDHRLVQSLPKGTRVENIESCVGTRMVTVLIPPRSTRPVHLVSGEHGLGGLQGVPEGLSVPEDHPANFRQLTPLAKWRLPGQRNATGKCLGGTTRPHTTQHGS
jgi:hypothetical protein